MFFFQIFNTLILALVPVILIFIAIIIFFKRSKSTNNKISELEIDDLYYSAGIQKNASAWYQAMDALLLPSFFEGFPMVCVEGQASGLPCFLSNNISNEISITNKVKFIPIEKYDEVKWAKEIDNDLRDMRRNNADFPKEYILKYAVKRLQDKYRELLKQ